ncbi:hypothetical protein D3C85_1166170 [compost metagenome]
MVLDVLGQDRRGHKVISGDVEEALNLTGVQIHRQDAVSAGAGDHVGDQLGRDGRAAAGLPVLTGVTEVGHDRRDPPRRRPHQGVRHDQQLHQVVVGRIGGRLDDEDVLAADVLLDDRKDLVVGESFHLGLGQRHVEVIGDGLGQGPVRIAREQLHYRSSFCRHRCANEHSRFWTRSLAADRFASTRHDGFRCIGMVAVAAIEIAVTTAAHRGCAVTKAS